MEFACFCNVSQAWLPSPHCDLGAAGLLHVQASCPLHVLKVLAQLHHLGCIAVCPQHAGRSSAMGHPVCDVGPAQVHARHLSIRPEPGSGLIPANHMQLLAEPTLQKGAHQSLSAMWL